MKMRVVCALCAFILVVAIGSPALAQPVNPQYGPYHKVECAISPLSDCLLDAAGLQNYCISNLGWGAQSCVGADATQTVRTEFYRAWIEYNEDGSPADSKQREAIVARLQDLHDRGQPVLIVAYVHGWHHNAGPGDNNVQKFNDLLARYSDSLQRNFSEISPSDKPVVFGIYVGWRGEELPSEVGLVRYALTIKGRSRVADAIGRAGYLKSDLGQISNEMHDTDRMVVIGHSLGGRMLTSAFIKDFSKNSQPLGRNTWIVTINAAVSADCYDDVFRRPAPIASSTGPTWLNWTNEDDDATGDTYWAGHLISAIKSCSRRGPASEKAIGHYNPYLTHDVSFKYLGNRQCVEVGCLDVLRNCVDGSEHCSTSDEWFKGSPRDSLIVYLRRGAWGYDQQDAGLYRVAFGFYRGVHNRWFWNEDGYYWGKNRLRRKNVLPLWNIHTDSTAIDIPGSRSATSPRHNGYVSTNMTRLLVHLMYSQYTIPGFQRNEAARQTSESKSAY